MQNAVAEKTDAGLKTECTGNPVETFNPFKIRKNKKVCICGTAPTINQTPFNDQSFDIWGVAHNLFQPQVTRLDMVFEIHNEEIWRKDNAPFSRFPNAKLIMDKQYPDLPNSIKFPLKEVLDEFKVNKGFANEMNYQSSSLSYMICLAIMNGYEEIHVYGIHLLMEEEYFFQKPCFEYYLGVARGKGIKIFIPDGADILKFGYLYGFQTKEADAFISKNKDRLDEFDKRISAIQNQIAQMTQQANAQLNQLLGARDDVVYQLRQFGKETRGGNYVKF